MSSPVLTDDLKLFLHHNGYSFLREQEVEMMNGSCIVGLRRFLYSVGLCYGIDDDGFVGRYCFETMSEAIHALEKWNGQKFPPGDWIKHKGHVGEFSNPNKDL
jgi:hypothetical protein